MIAQGVLIKLMIGKCHVIMVRFCKKKEKAKFSSIFYINGKCKKEKKPLAILNSYEIHQLKLFTKYPYKYKYLS